MLWGGVALGDAAAQAATLKQSVTPAKTIERDFFIISENFFDSFISLIPTAVLTLTIKPSNKHIRPVCYASPSFMDRPPLPPPPPGLAHPCGGMHTCAYRRPIRTLRNRHPTDKTLWPLVEARRTHQNNPPPPPSINTSAAGRPGPPPHRTPRPRGRSRASHPPTRRRTNQGWCRPPG